MESEEDEDEEEDDDRLDDVWSVHSYGSRTTYADGRRQSVLARLFGDESCGIMQFDCQAPCPAARKKSTARPLDSQSISPKSLADLSLIEDNEDVDESQPEATHHLETDDRVVVDESQPRAVHPLDADDRVDVDESKRGEKHNVDAEDGKDGSESPKEEKHNLGADNGTSKDADESQKVEVHTLVSEDTGESGNEETQNFDSHDGEDVDESQKGEIHNFDADDGASSVVVRVTAVHDTFATEQSSVEQPERQSSLGMFMSDPVYSACEWVDFRCCGAGLEPNVPPTLLAEPVATPEPAKHTQTQEEDTNIKPVVTPESVKRTPEEEEEEERNEIDTVVSERTQDWSINDLQAENEKLRYLLEKLNPRKAHSGKLEETNNKLKAGIEFMKRTVLLDEYSELIREYERLQNASKK